MPAKSETHHHIKNILQSILSYLSTGIGRKGAAADEVKKLQQFIYLQSFLQDLVYGRDEVDFKSPVRADLAVEKVLNLIKDSGFPISHEELPEFSCGVKRSANLGLIIIEQIYFLKANGASAAEFRLNETGEEEIEIIISAALPEPEAAVNAAEKELMLAGMLIRSDLKSSAQYSAEQGFQVRFRFNPKA